MIEINFVLHQYSRLLESPPELVLRRDATIHKVFDKLIKVTLTSIICLSMLVFLFYGKMSTM